MGETRSADPPLKDPLQSVPAGPSDGFYLLLALANLPLQSTYFGGDREAAAHTPVARVRMGATQVGRELAEATRKGQLSFHGMSLRTGRGSLSGLLANHIGDVAARLIEQLPLPKAMEVGEVMDVEVRRGM